MTIVLIVVKTSTTVPLQQKAKEMLRYLICNFKEHRYLGNSVLAVDIIPLLPPNPGDGARWSVVYRGVNTGLQDLPRQCAQGFEFDTPFCCVLSKSNPLYHSQLKRLLSFFCNLCMSHLHSTHRKTIAIAKSLVFGQ